MIRGWKERRVWKERLCLVGVIAASYVVEVAWAAPDWRAVGTHALLPQFAGPDSVLLAVGANVQAAGPEVLEPAPVSVTFQRMGAKHLWVIVSACREVPGLRLRL